MKIANFGKILVLAGATILSAQTVVAETVLKLGTTGRLGMPIGDAIDQALIPAMEKASGGKMRIEPHYQRSLCAEQKCGEQANQGLIAYGQVQRQIMVISVRIGNFRLPFIFKSLEMQSAYPMNGWQKGNAS